MQTFKTKRFHSNKTTPGRAMQKTLVIFLLLQILLFAKTSFTKEAGCLKDDCKNGEGIR